MSFLKIETIEDIFNRPIPLYIYKQHLVLDLGENNQLPMSLAFSEELFFDNRVDFGIDPGFFPELIRLR